MKYIVALAILISTSAPSAFAEFRSAKDMQKECRVAVDLMQNRVEKSFENSLFTGECIGYVQGAVDVAVVVAENVNWFKVCIPENVPTLNLIQKFVAFVDKNPKYTLASTAIQLMLVEEYSCKK